MPGTPPTTDPDLLPRIGDTDSPDIPRDMNALADKTQEALTKIRTDIAASPQLNLSGQAFHTFAPTNVPNGGAADTVMQIASGANLVNVTWSNNNHLTIQKGGWWAFTFYMNLGIACTGRTYAEVHVQSSTAGEYGTRASMAPGENIVAASGILLFNVGNDLWFNAYQTSGATRAVGGAFMVKYIGPNG